MFSDGQTRHRRSAAAPAGGLDETNGVAVDSQQKPAENLSFSNLSSLTQQFGQQFWTNAQTSIAALADTYTQAVDQPYLSSFSSWEQQTQQPEKRLLEFDFIVMPHSDRTAEFRTVAKSFQMKLQAQNGRVNNTDGRNKLIQSSIQFNQLAKRIGRDLSITCAKMEKLAELAKKKSLFDDRTVEIDELSNIIKKVRPLASSRLTSKGLNSQIANLQQVIKSRQVNAEQGTHHSKLVVVGLQAKLVSLGNEFKCVQEKRTETLKEKSRRREQFSQSQAVPYGLPPSASTGNMGSVLLRDEAEASGSSQVVLDMEQIQQQEQLALIDETETYHKSRFNAMQQIESSISELGQIFSQLSMLVAEQGETITRIDSNLLRYFNNISKNRWLMLKVFGVLMAFFVFFVVFLA
ncbi:T-SNARE coiled-coil-like proteiny domain-containing protein [Aphelenchoides fujianensis]|nr:T-SNARE coiled-coil-like proteiny domain-containing protein [Aphelenchoides fujianensis]